MNATGARRPSAPSPHPSSLVDPSGRLRPQRVGTRASTHATALVAEKSCPRLRRHAICKARRVMNIEAEVSLYPLTETHLQHPVHDFDAVLKSHGCTVEMGPMSSIVKGESTAVFEALRIGYEEEPMPPHGQGLQRLPLVGAAARLHSVRGLRHPARLPGGCESLCAPPLPVAGSPASRASGQQDPLIQRGPSRGALFKAGRQCASSVFASRICGLRIRSPQAAVPRAAAQSASNPLPPGSGIPGLRLGAWGGRR